VQTKLGEGIPEVNDRGLEHNSQDFNDFIVCDTFRVSTVCAMGIILVPTL